MRPRPRSLSSTAVLCLVVLSLSAVFVALAGAPNRLSLPLVYSQWGVASPTPRPGTALLSEVMYDPTSDEPGGEWIELYNPGTTVFDLSGWMLGDEETRGGGEGMFAFPRGTSIGPGDTLLVAYQAVVFISMYGFAPDFEMYPTDSKTPDMQRIASWGTGSFNLGNPGDEVVLITPGGSIADTVSWGNSSFAFYPPAIVVFENHTLERYPPGDDTDTAVDWRENFFPSPGEVDLTVIIPTRVPTKTQTPTLQPTARLLISEVLFSPMGDEPDGEWVEVFNPEDYAVLLAGYLLGDDEDLTGLEGMLRFPPSAEVAAGDVVVIAVKASAFWNVYGFLPDFEVVNTLPSVPDMLPYTTGGSFSLNNTGDEVLLLDRYGYLIDGLSWGSSTLVFSPAAPAVSKGHSLERRPADVDTDTAADWVDNVYPSPGSVTVTEATATPSPTATTDPQEETPSHTPDGTLTLTPTWTSPPTPEDAFLLISEVLVNPSTGLEGEWMELHNAGGTSLDIGGYKIGDEETREGSEGMMLFPPGTAIGSGEVLVIAHSAAVFHSTYGFLPDFELMESSAAVPNLLPYTGWSPGSVNLSNAGDEVLVLDASDQVVDALSWGSSIWAFNPSIVAPLQGVSLERFPAGVDTDSAADWVQQVEPDPGAVRLW